MDVGDPGEYQHRDPAPGPAVTSAGYPGPSSKTNGLAIASLVLGIVWLYWLGSILALVFGYVAKSQIDRSNGTQSGRGLAIAGIVLGWVGTGVLAVVIVLVILGTSSGLPTSLSVSDGGADSRGTGARQTDLESARRTLESYSAATHDKDYRRICDDIYAKDLVDRVRAAGLPCEVALETGLGARQNPQLAVLGVEVNGDQALARVRSTAGGEPTSTDLVRLVKEDGGWRLASLSEPGATLQSP